MEGAHRSIHYCRALRKIVREDNLLILLKVREEGPPEGLYTVHGRKARAGSLSSHPRFESFLIRCFRMNSE